MVRVRNQLAWEDFVKKGGADQIEKIAHAWGCDKIKLSLWSEDLFLKLFKDGVKEEVFEVPFYNIYGGTYNFWGLLYALKEEEVKRKKDN
ncbi:hypothetical protein KVC52_06670 [Helicobacter pylori]|nr:hypothetical protein KVC52_06670 [Helicobacter pylori]